MANNKLELTPLKLPLIKHGDNLSKLILDAAEHQANGIKDGDIIILTSKIISKAKGYVIDPSTLKIGRKARLLSKITKVPLHVIQACIEKHGDPIYIIPYSKALEQPGIIKNITRNIEKARELMKNYPNMLLYKTPWGFATDCGIDFSNIPGQKMSYPPPDPSKEARELRIELEEKTGKRIGVVITDTEMSVLRPGSLEIAIGTSGVKILNNEFAEKDLYDKPKIGGIDLIADQIANAAGLLMGQTSSGTPVVILRGAENLLAEDEDIDSYVVSDKTFGKLFYASFMRTLLMNLIIKILNILGIK